VREIRRHAPSRRPIRRWVDDYRFDLLAQQPPSLLMSSTIIRTVSFRVISLIAIVPLNECYTPILIVSSALAGDVAIARTMPRP